MQPLPAWIADFRPDPSPGEAYYRYLLRAMEEIDTRLGWALFADGPMSLRFKEDELVVPGYYRKQPPPPELFPNLVVPMAMTMLVRQGMKSLGFGPLSVVATYRPSGGAAKSLHKVNRAIDLSPAKKTKAACQALMLCARWVYQKHEHLAIGVGTYGPHMDRTTLLHIDVCGRKGRKSWRHHKGASVTSAVRGQALVLLGAQDG